MPLVKFTQTKVVQVGTAQEERYEEGQIYDLPESSVERWKKRGCAVDVTSQEETKFRAPRARAMAEKLAVPITPPKPAPAPAPAPVKEDKEAFVPLSEHKPIPVTPTPVVSTEITIPPEYKTFSWPRLKALASRISGGPVNTRDDALQIVEEEVARRKTM